MKARAKALLRLLTVQASYTYERMGGIGVGYACEPLLRDVFDQRSASERVDAVARSADFFNSHPYLAGVAVGAEVKAEQDGLPGAMISRLRTALSGPLGSLGDQLIWAGWVPALVGLALVAVPWVGFGAVVVMVLVHNALRMAVTAWGLNLGLREGIQVGSALQRSWLPRSAEIAQRIAGFAVGLALPVVAAVALDGVRTMTVVAVAVTGVVGAALTVAPLTRARVTGLRFGLFLLVAATVLAGAMR